MMRAVDELITLMTKVCRQSVVVVCRSKNGTTRCGTVCLNKFQMFDKFRATAQKMSKSGFFWNDRERADFRRDLKTGVPGPIMTEEVFRLNEVIESQK